MSKTIILLLILELISANDHCSDPDVVVQDSPTPEECINFDSDAKSVLVKESNGRLGNQMFSYAMMLNLKMKFGFQTYITRKTKYVFVLKDVLLEFQHLTLFNSDMLKPYFDNLAIPVAEDRLCDFEQVIDHFRLVFSIHIYSSKMSIELKLVIIKVMIVILDWNRIRIEGWTRACQEKPCAFSGHLLDQVWIVVRQESLETR